MQKLKLGIKDINTYVSYPKNKKGPAVLILHAWWGLNDFIKQLCDKLSAEGYFVLAPDFYHGKLAKTITEAENLVKTINQSETSKMLLSLSDYLKKNEFNTSERISVIGFSLGASWASWLANNSADNINKVIIFYGTGETDFSNTKASFLCHFADNDPYEEPKYVKMYLEALEKAGITVTSYTYPDTHHWFFESDKTDYYKEEASKLAWNRTIEFLN